MAMSSTRLEGTEEKKGAGVQSLPDGDWETAQQRVLLYLKCMYVAPGKDRLALAAEALKNVKTEVQGAAIPRDAMEAVQNLLRKSDGVLQGKIEPKLYSMGIFERQVEGLKSFPPLNRGNMIAVKFEQLPQWLSTGSFFATVLLHLRPLLLPIFILINLLLLISLFFWF